MVEAGLWCIVAAMYRLKLWQCLLFFTLAALNFLFFVFALFWAKTVWIEAVSYKYFFANGIFTCDHSEKKKQFHVCARLLITVRGERKKI